MRGFPDSAYLEEIRDLPSGSTHIKRILWSGLLLSLGAVALYFMQDQLRDVLQSGERLRTIRPGWFGVMLGCEAVSFVCLWWLTRTVLPRVSWFVAATSQLVSNAVSRVIPGGAATGGAVYYRMLAASGVQPTEAGGALAATSILTTAALVAIPSVAGLMALLGAPIPESLLPAAVAGAVMFLVLAAVGAIGMAFNRPLDLVERALDRLFRLTGRALRRTWGVSRGLLRSERDRLVEVLGSRWPVAIAASAGKWAFDYLALIAALYGVGADPRLSLVLLAYAGAQVLAMIPITPGGFGFVEVGLYSMLVISGISAQDASLAAVAYRLVSLWVPIVSGLGAYLAFLGRSHRVAQGVATPDGPGIGGGAGAGTAPSVGSRGSEGTRPDGARSGARAETVEPW
jgi:uncharacterized protein (TIRG00374 family)